MCVASLPFLFLLHYIFSQIQVLQNIFQDIVISITVIHAINWHILIGVM